MTMFYHTQVFIKQIHTKVKTTFKCKNNYTRKLSKKVHMLTLQTGQETQPVRREDQKESYPAITRKGNQNSVVIFPFKSKHLQSVICLCTKDKNSNAHFIGEIEQNVVHSFFFLQNL